jgi:hypothetical protein
MARLEKEKKKRKKKGRKGNKGKPSAETRPPIAVTENARLIHGPFVGLARRGDLFRN